MSDEHLTLGRDITIPHQLSDETLGPYKKLANAIHSNSSSLAIMQLSHTGRQSSNLITGRLKAPLAPSAVALGADIPWSDFGKRFFYWAMFRTPTPMSTEDIGNVVSRFVMGAKTAHQSGFDGIQLHAAHGCESLRLTSYSCILIEAWYNAIDLLAQFLSPKVCVPIILIAFSLLWINSFIL